NWLSRKNLYVVCCKTALGRRDQRATTLPNIPTTWRVAEPHFRSANSAEAREREMKRHEGGPAISSPFQKTAAAGECFIGEKVENRIPAESFDEDGVQCRVNSIDKHLPLRADFEGYMT